MAEKKEVAEFKNMFDTPVGKTLINDDISDDMETFDSLSDSIGDRLPGKKEIIENPKSESEAKVEEIKVEEIKVEEIKVEEIKVEEIEKEQQEENIEEGGVQWFLKSPTPLYDEFYSLKKDMINRCTPGGYLPFDDWTNELIDCHVDIKKEVFDNKSYIMQMTKIQNYMERVKNIQIKCNNQYFLWEVFVPHLKGSLARVEYLKPAIKQDGLVNQHMKDVEWYYAKVQHIHESAKGVMKTLEKAFETVSRKASLATPPRPAEKYDKRESGNVSNREQLDDYDNLPENAQVTRKKVGDFCNWDEIG